MVQFGPFLRAQDDLAPAICSKLLAILSDPAKNAHLRVQLAAVVDRGECLVKTTYKLEGDGPLALCAFQVVNTLLASIRVSHFPNVTAIIKQLCPGNPSAQQKWVAYATGCLQPSASSIGSDLSALPFFDALTVSNLQAELPLYLAKAVDFAPTVCPV